MEGGDVREGEMEGGDVREGEMEGGEGSVSSSRGFFLVLRSFIVCSMERWSLLLALGTVFEGMGRRERYRGNVMEGCKEGGEGWKGSK